MTIIKIITWALLSGFFFPDVSFSESLRALVLKRDVSQYNRVLDGLKQQISAQKLSIDLEIINIDVEQEVLEGTRRKESPDLVIAIGTKSQHFAVDQFVDIPVIFALVLNPAGTIMGSKKSAADRIMTGVLAHVDPDKYLLYAKRIQPQLKKIGLLYSTPFFKSYVSVMRSKAMLYDLEIIEQQVHSKMEFNEAFLSVINKNVDVFLILPDFQLYDKKYIRYILLQAFRERIPCIGPSYAFVKAGALWGLTPEPFNIGQQVAALIVKFMHGNELPLEYAAHNELTINLVTSRALAIQIPQAILGEAREIITAEK
ncbi:ABC transporter substrate-binding protein [candidate division CSSED10-310 bacterium]|uniref:ABC transporter substrate-binding protein n=1 Tax=candidate division CSSED10-310 bacterium TaxID=2855610 RepID=A0ABV6Z3X1_UNCC1